MTKDTISDFLTSIRNATMAGKFEISTPWSKSLEQIAKILKSEGYIINFKKEGAKLAIKLDPGKTVSHLKRLSKPGVRRYTKLSEITRPLGGSGFVIISTPKGMMTGSQAKKQKVGGELICEVW